MKDPISGEIGKSIIFCVSQKHASKITHILNQMAQKMWPDKYNSDFARQVTSDTENSQQNTILFINNKLRGYTEFFEGYKTSKTRVCVTVGMMTTGYDCQDILNLCLMRLIFSPTNFVQMKGRGTRKFVFKYEDKNKKKHQIEKEKFKLFDFFANCEYFEEKFNYDEALKLPQLTVEAGSGEESPPITIDEIEIHVPDKISTISEIQVGEAGMKVDRELWDKAKEVFYNDNRIKKAVEEENWQVAENIVRYKYEDKPELYLNLEKIRRSENLDRRLSWKEVLERTFGFIDRFPTKEELLENECEKFVSIYKPENQHVLPIKNYLSAYIVDSEFREIIDSKKYGDLHSYTGFSMTDFKALNGNTKWQTKVPEYVKNYVTLNTYMD